MGMRTKGRRWVARSKKSSRTTTLRRRAFSPNKARSRREHVENRVAFEIFRVYRGLFISAFSRDVTEASLLEQRVNRPFAGFPLSLSLSLSLCLRRRFPRSRLSETGILIKLFLLFAEPLFRQRSCRGPVATEEMHVRDLTGVLGPVCAREGRRQDSWRGSDDPTSGIQIARRQRAFNPTDYWLD